MPQNIRKGDLVQVIAGKAAKDKRVGKVLHVIRDADPNKTRVIVEGVNVHRKHVRPDRTRPQGGIIEKEMSIHISNVLPVVDGKPTRVRFQTRPDGSKVRIAVSNGQPFGPELRKARA